MGDITLGMIAEGLGILTVICGGFGVLYKKLKEWIGNLTDAQIQKVETNHKEQMEKIEKHHQEQMQKIGDEIKTLEERLDTSDMESCKNFLVRCIADIERDQPMSETEYQRFCEQYEHYTKNNGNTYIKEKVEKLKKAGKL